MILIKTGIFMELCLTLAYEEKLHKMIRERERERVIGRVRERERDREKSARDFDFKRL